MAREGMEQHGEKKCTEEMKNKGQRKETCAK